jgi:hypothetical protein
LHQDARRITAGSIRNGSTGSCSPGSIIARRFSIYGQKHTYAFKKVLVKSIGFTSQKSIGNTKFDTFLKNYRRRYSYRYKKVSAILYRDTILYPILKTLQLINVRHLTSKLN